MVLRRSFSGIPLGRLESDREHSVRRRGTWDEGSTSALISDVPTSHLTVDWLLRSLLGSFPPSKTQSHGCS